MRQARAEVSEFGVGRVGGKAQFDPWPAYLKPILERRFEYDPLNQDFVQRYPDMPLLSWIYPQRWRSYGRARADMRWFSKLARYYLGRMGSLEATWFGLWNNIEPPSEITAEQFKQIDFAMYEDYDKSNFDKVADHKEYQVVDF